MNDQKPMAEIFPACFESVLELLSPDAMQAFCGAFGGQEYRIPENLKPNAPLALHLGYQEAKRLIAALGGARLYVPTLERANKRTRDAEMYAAHAGGESLHKIALRHGMTTRQVRNIVQSQDDQATATGRAGDGIQTTATRPQSSQQRPAVPSLKARAR